MQVNCTEDIIKYSRSIEGMGEGLVLFKISVVSKRIGQNYHLFFEDKIKPPLDIAISPDSGTVEYCSYFAQDEKVVERVIMNDIQYKDGLVTIKGEFCEEKTGIYIDKKFDILKSNNDIFILCENMSNISLQAYRIDDFNYLLFSNGFDFSGVLLKDISEKEWAEIKNSQCI